MDKSSGKETVLILGLRPGPCDLAQVTVSLVLPGSVVFYLGFSRRPFNPGFIFCLGCLRRCPRDAGPGAKKEDLGDGQTR